MRVPSRSGSVMMEFVISMPILFLLIMMVLQFAHIWLARQLLSYAAFCSARSALSCNFLEKDKAAKAAAVRVLSWINVSGSPRSYRLRDSGLSDFSDGSDEILLADVDGAGSFSGDLKIPGWGTVPESDTCANRVSVNVTVVPQRFVLATVKFNFPCLMPVAGQMISYLSRHGVGETTATYRQGVGWVGGENTSGGVPTIELADTCLLPLPYSTTTLPLAAYSYSTR